ncbi:MAG: UDP-N-acetylmuramate dehydrogenase [Bacteroidota bacterium]
MLLKQNFSLKEYNTFGIDVVAASFVAIHSVEELQQILLKNNDSEKIMILGGGSNMLLTKDLDRLVVHNQIKGFEIVAEEKDHSIVAVGGGENWHEFVLMCVENDLGGVENLSLIPGTVGAAPIQNIGAYGVELKDVFERLEAVELSTGKVYTFDKTACQFGYRDSVFKRDLKGKFCITKVYFRLSKQQHQLNTSYGAIAQVLDDKNINSPSIKDISDAVIEIRQSKLPDPKVLGNSGSFFKNPEIPLAQFEDLQQRFPEIVHYSLPNGKVKVPAGWLIEQCGWKGKRIGNTGAYEKQALVLVNYGGATGEEVFLLAKEIAASVKSKFGITITPEVNVL